MKNSSRFNADRIVAELEKHGTPGDRVQEHLDAVHPERRPYRGGWRISIHDRLVSDDDSVANHGDTIAIVNDRIGTHSLVTLTLEYEADFAGYFRLSVQGGRAGLFETGASAEPPA